MSDPWYFHTDIPPIDDDVELGVMLVEMWRCNGTTVAGGAVMHERRCPLHGEPPPVRALLPPADDLEHTEGAQP